MKINRLVAMLCMVAVSAAAISSFAACGGGFDDYYDYGGWGDDYGSGDDYEGDQGEMSEEEEKEYWTNMCWKSITNHFKNDYSKDVSVLLTDITELDYYRNWYDVTDISYSISFGKLIDSEVNTTTVQENHTEKTYSNDALIDGVMRHKYVVTEGKGKFTVTETKASYAVCKITFTNSSKNESYSGEGYLYYKDVKSSISNRINICKESYPEYTDTEIFAEIQWGETLVLANERYTTTTKNFVEFVEITRQYESYDET